MNINFLEIAQEVIAENEAKIYAALEDRFTDYLAENEAKIYAALEDRFADYLDEYAIAEAIMPCPTEIERLLTKAATEYFRS